MANALLSNESMKTLLLIGGLIGFGCGLALGLVREKSLPSALAHACIALYVAGLLLRWWGKVWINALKQAQKESKP